MSESIDYDSDEEEEVKEEPRRKKKGKKTDFMAVGGNLISNINYKVAFLLFIVSMVIFSDVFIENVISKFDGAVAGECTSTKGTMVQLTCVVIAYILLDLVVKYEFI